MASGGKRDHLRIADRFRGVADRATRVLGTPWALFVAIGLIAIWAVSGPVFGFSDTWQLAINTGTTILTFLMVFVIQTSQNRQAKATQFKLDELIKAMPGARNRMIAAEGASEAEEKRNERAFARASREPSEGRRRQRGDQHADRGGKGRQGRRSKAGSA